MKVNQIVGEHKKGFRAKKYARKPVNAVGPIKPQGPVGAEQDKKKVAEATPANVTVKPVVGAQEIDVNGQKIATTTDPVAAATMAQLAKDGKIIPGTTNPAQSTGSLEEGPDGAYGVQAGPQPMATTSPRPTAIVPSKLWTAITPEVEETARVQGFRKVMLQFNGKMIPGLEGGDQKLGSKIIVAPTDFQSMSTPGAGTMRRSMGVQSAEKTGIGAPPMKESPELDAMLRIAGLR